MSWALFAHPLTANFAIGVSVVFVSMHQFFTFGDAKGGKAPAGSDGGGAGGAGGAANGGRPPPAMLHSPSMEHFRLESGPVSNSSSVAALGALAEGAEFGGLGGGSGGARAPLLPR